MTREVLNRQKIYTISVFVNLRSTSVERNVTHEPVNLFTIDCTSTRFDTRSVKVIDRLKKYSLRDNYLLKKSFGLESRGAKMRCNNKKKNFYISWHHCWRRRRVNVNRRLILSKQQIRWCGQVTASIKFHAFNDHKDLSDIFWYTRGGSPSILSSRIVSFFTSSTLLFGRFRSADARL